MDDWRVDAACLDVDPEMFHPTPTDGRWRAAEARKVCARCPVVAECLADTPVEDRTSIRGGLTGVERQKLRNGGVTHGTVDKS